MSQLRSEPVVSGKPYAVVEVKGTPPAGLDEFGGDTSFLLTLGSHHHEVVGVGTVVDGMALVHEKGGEDGGGKDVRVWQVTNAPGGFVAEHVTF